MMVLTSLHPVTGLALTLAVTAAALMKPQATYNCKPKEHCWYFEIMLAVVLLAYATEIKVVVVLMSINATEHGKQCR